MKSKRMRILGLSLGFIGLAAIGTTIPFIVTSCSNTIQVDPETGFEEVKIQETAVEFSSSYIMIDDERYEETPYENILQNNTINYVVPKTNQLYIMLALNLDVKSVLSIQDIETLGIDPNSKVEWTLNGWDNYDGIPDKNKAVGFVTNKLTNTQSYKLIGKVGNIKFKIDVNIIVE